MMARLFAWALALAGAAVSLPSLGYLWFVHYQPDRERHSVRGIDASHHQGAIDWPKVAKDDVAFAYLKASEGGDHRDRRFAEHWRAARAAGIDVGAYHFFTLCRSGAAQAKNFIAVVPVERDALPPAVDLEFGGNCGRRPEGPALRREIDDFLAAVERAYGKSAVLYLTPEFLEAYRAHLPPRALWRRSLLRVPDDSAPWHLWQYHNRGRVRGIRGPVDLNVFVSGRAEYAAWKRGVSLSAKYAD
jgi:lysozyme